MLLGVGQRLVFDVLQQFQCLYTLYTTSTWSQLSNQKKILTPINFYRLFRAGNQSRQIEDYYLHTKEETNRVWKVKKSINVAIYSG